MPESFIFPPPAPAGTPFQLLLAGTSHCNGNYLVARSRPRLWVLEYVECGTGTYETEGRTVHPSAGDVYFVHAGTNHRYYSDAKNPWVKHWINFTGPLVAELEKLYGLQDVILAPAFSRPELFLDLLRHLRLHPERSHSQLGPEFLMAVLTTIASDSVSARRRQPVSEIGECLRHHLDQCICSKRPTLAELATLAMRSEVQTIRIFKRDFGETPSQYLMRRKIDAACELLRSTTETVKVIANELGFEDEYHFATLFKRKTGLAPGHYRHRG